MSGTATAPEVTIVPANEASWEDLQAVLGRRGCHSGCWCQRFKIGGGNGKMITAPGKEITWGELHVGSRSIFEAAGFAEVSHPTLRRVVMRIDF